MKMPLLEYTGYRLLGIGMSSEGDMIRAFDDDDALRQARQLWGGALKREISRGVRLIMAFDRHECAQ